MASQSNTRTRTKQIPSFPRDRQQQHQQPAEPSTPLTQTPLPQNYFIPQQPQQPYLANGDLEAWRLHTLQSSTLVSTQPRHSSRGPRTSSPAPSVDSQSARAGFPWDQTNHYPTPRYRRKSITSNTSSSDHHHQLHLLRSPRLTSRSPSPGTPRTSLSPRALRTPASISDFHKRPVRKMTNGSNGTGGSSGPPCALETALVNSRRRIPYSVGSEPLATVSPDQYHARLDEKDERCLTVDILELYHHLLPMEDTEERRRLFIEKLSGVLRREFPSGYTEVHVFGSSENRNIQCDINVNNSLAIENTRLIKLYTDIDERVRPLAMLIKYWAKSRVLNDAAGGGTLTSYTWILMVINFLQTRNPPILPSLQKLPHKQRFSNGIDVGFCDDLSQLKDFGVKNVETLGGLLYAFFLKFAFEFDFDNEVISVRTGGSLRKSDKSEWLKEHNKSLCVEEPFNTSRNLGNTADDATVKGLRLEFRRAVHYLADHASLELTCWPYQFPTSENPRPERHLPNLPPQYRQNVTSQYRRAKYTRPTNVSPPFKSPKARAQDVGHQRNFNSFSGSRQQQYPFNPLSLNPLLPPQIPIPSTPQSSSLSSTMSPAGDIPHAYPPTPVDQLHYIDPFKNQKVAYYIPAFAPNGIPIYVPYTEDQLVYASPPQTPAMSDASLSHQPQYPRGQQYAFPQQYSRNQSIQRGRPTHRADIGSPQPTFADQQQPPLSGIGISTGPGIVGPPYVPPPMKRRNSLPPNNKPNVSVQRTTPVVSSDSSSYTPSSSTNSQGLAGSMSSLGESDVFEEDEFFQRRQGEYALTTETSETPRPSVSSANGPLRSPGGKSDVADKVPAGKSYAAALLNTTAMKSPTMTHFGPVKKEGAVNAADKKSGNGPAKTPTINFESPTPKKESKKDIRDDVSSRSTSPLDNHRKSSSSTMIWSNIIQPTSSLEPTPISPSVSHARRASIVSTASASPKKPARQTPTTNKSEQPRKSSVLTIPDNITVDSSGPKKKKGRKKKSQKDNGSIVSTTAITNGVSIRRQSIPANA